MLLKQYQYKLTQVDEILHFLGEKVRVPYNGSGSLAWCPKWVILDLWDMSATTLKEKIKHTGEIIHNLWKPESQQPLFRLKKERAMSATALTAKPWSNLGSTTPALRTVFCLSPRMWKVINETRRCDPIIQAGELPLLYHYYTTLS